MTRLGIFITEEEAEGVMAHYRTSGMFLSGGVPMGDPQGEVRRLCQKYNLAIDGSVGLDVKSREFISVD